ncbi:MULTISPECIES: molybdenum cofactor guanylyltransferase MobA [Halomonadaceae]|jgi:molybdopterin-guanine dinucleotide biosynthesis protein A|uniref:Molybdenum cofactor guanylyltransferase n=1 Tax=Vreelandella janggokensis TaxID=370767 RepID=A0ABT4IVC4_9GAMM|nr:MULTISPECIES: molybdenum cofactor guanylyltransferase MobA [Halomonas]MCW4150498.1 molybdenum cofactor guanylyltransferase [Halomonas sp. 18H]MCZ0927128.1 molybdenum cofactor guanylyltransferase [Halomonas janggokensis]MCZ0929636.1 molybdenum cofactor guanylyltransferase [Halomonas janggokensis]MDR5886162.1 molybdenum cofactor guanylyltransferase MobA [Halomonas janggokensis]QPL45724.1 molybdenum cofactor guanylyltransferase [Halomonas sp. A40-4]
MISAKQLTGMVLAGGEGRRMGGRDKGLEPFAGLPLIAHVIQRFDGRVAELLINANRNSDAYELFADRVIEDAEGGFKGPLMGIYSGLRAAKTPWLLVAPCDSPALPNDLVARMVAGIGEHDIAVAFDGERMHPVVALIRTSLADDLATTLADGERKIDRWYARHAWCRVDMSDCAEAFANLNTEEEKIRLETALGNDASAKKAIT